MHAKQKLTQQYEQLSALLKGVDSEVSTIPLEEYEARYKKLKAIHSFFGLPWDQIEKEIKSTEYKEEWIWESRKEPHFKKYYKLRAEIDKLEVLVK